MSKFCMATLNSIQNTMLFYEQIRKTVHYFNLGVSFDVDYYEPFVDEFCKDTDIICNFHDSPNAKNCECLMLPDNCMINGLHGTEPFRERAKKIHTILQSIRNYASEIHLFVGDSGTHLHEFTEEYITLNEFVKAFECINSIFSPDVHFIIR